eukprot:3758866-Rhodomonas_salina.2
MDGGTQAEEVAERLSGLLSLDQDSLADFQAPPLSSHARAHSRLTASPRACCEQTTRMRSGGRKKNRALSPAGGAKPHTPKAPLEYSRRKARGHEPGGTQRRESCSVRHSPCSRCVCLSVSLCMRVAVWRLLLLRTQPPSAFSPGPPLPPRLPRAAWSLSESRLQCQS